MRIQTGYNIIPNSQQRVLEPRLNGNYENSAKAEVAGTMSTPQILRDSFVQRNIDGDTYEKTIKDPNYECQTCKNRKYQDGSDEMVSFKTPAHISPQNAAGAVMAHEQEHVANAYKKADEADGEVIQASVQLYTAVCPECGRTYVAGGTTTTQIAYRKNNPYKQELDALFAGSNAGKSVNLAG